MPDYSKAKLYTIRSHHTDKIYIGSTCERLSKRLFQHRRDYKLFKEGNYHYISSFEIIQYADNYIELLRAVPCVSRQELHKLEGEEIRAADNRVNMHIAGRTKKEYYKEHKEHLNQYKKEWHQKNRENILQRYQEKKDIRECLCGGHYNCAIEDKRERHYGTQKHEKYIIDFYTRLNEQLTK